MHSLVVPKRVFNVVSSFALTTETHHWNKCGEMLWNGKIKELSRDVEAEGRAGGRKSIRMSFDLAFRLRDDLTT